MKLAQLCQEESDDIKDETRVMKDAMSWSEYDDIYWLFKQRLNDNQVTVTEII